MGNAKKPRNKKTEKEGVFQGQGQAQGEQPSKQKKQPTTKVMWITVLFSNGERFKVPAKIIARRMAELKQVPYDDVIREPEVLVEFAQNYMTWVDVAQSAHQYTLDIMADYVGEWKKADKSVIMEPAPTVAKPVNPNVKPDFATAKTEDAGMNDLETAPEGEVVDLD